MLSLEKDQGGDLIALYNPMKRGYASVRFGFFPQITSIRQKALSCTRGGSRLDVRKTDNVLEKAAHRDGGVTVPRGVQEARICGTEEHGLVDMVGMV